MKHIWYNMWPLLQPFSLCLIVWIGKKYLSLEFEIISLKLHNQKKLFCLAYSPPLTNNQTASSVIENFVLFTKILLKTKISIPSQQISAFYGPGHDGKLPRCLDRRCFGSILLVLWTLCAIFIRLPQRYQIILCVVVVVSITALFWYLSSRQINFCLSLVSSLIFRSVFVACLCRNSSPLIFCGMGRRGEEWSKNGSRKLTSKSVASGADRIRTKPPFTWGDMSGNETVTIVGTMCCEVTELGSLYEILCTTGARWSEVKPH